MAIIIYCKADLLGVTSVRGSAVFEFSVVRVDRLLAVGLEVLLAFSALMARLALSSNTNTLS